MKRTLWVILMSCWAQQLSAQTVDSLTVVETRIGPSPWVLSISAGALGAQRLWMHPRKQDVPREGLNPETIWLGFDQRSVRAYNSHKDHTSDLLLWSTVAYPSVERFLLGESSETWWRGAGLQLEATGVATLSAFLLKSVISRPRPYTYLHTYSRSNEGPNWATSDQTFQSLPSGHATLAWASSMSRLSMMALQHPHRSKTTHFVCGLVAGTLATSSSLMRVEAGAHFPSDVVAGSLLGGGVGYAVPLLHGGERSPETGTALSWGLLGTLGGVLLGILVTPPASPFIN